MNKWFFLLLLVLISCKNNNDVSVKIIHWDNFSDKNTNELIPNSYVFSSTPVFSNKLWHYVDTSKNSLIILDENFNFHNSFEIIGESPNKIRRYSDMNLVNNYIFITGLTDLIIYNTYTGTYNYYKHNLGSFDLPSFFNDEYVTGHYNYKKKSYSISTFEFDDDKLFNIKHKLDVPFEKGTDSSEYSGLLQSLGNYLYFIKDWQGEVFKIDKNYTIVDNKLLEFSGPKNVNKEIVADGFLSIYFNAFSVTKFDDNYLAILREVDYQEKTNHDLTNLDPKYYKRKVHLMNSDLKIEKSIHLETVTTSINKKGDSLITSKFGEEYIYIYEFKH